MEKQNTTTSRSGSSCSIILDAVWKNNKTTTDPSVQLDVFGKSMKHCEYGKDTMFVWEIDQIEDKMRGQSLGLLSTRIFDGILHIKLDSKCIEVQS